MLGPVVEIPAALLVVAEIVRAARRHRRTLRLSRADRLVGRARLASCSCGLPCWASVIAFQRGEHMRMTAIVGMVAPRARAFLDVVAVAAAVGVSPARHPPGLRVRGRRGFSHDPGARNPELPGAPRRCRSASALMLLAAVLRLASVGDLRAGARRRGARRGSRCACTARARAEAPRQPEPADLLRRAWSGPWSSPACRSPSPSGWRPSATSR